MFKLKSIMKACQKIKAIHNIDVYDTFGLYFYNDERLNYEETKCHAIVGKNCTDDSLKQCSKPRSINNDSKKRHLYCQIHLKMVPLGNLEKSVICLDMKPLHVEDNNTTELTTTTTTTPTSIKLRHINIDGKVYYVDRKTLSMYDMDMSEIGKYAYDPTTEQHIICEM
jgi:hypothetical protein